MPLFPHIFVFKTISRGLRLSYIVPCDTSGDAERGREMLGEGNENGGREQYLAKSWTVNYTCEFCYYIPFCHAHIYYQEGPLPTRSHPMLVALLGWAKADWTPANPVLMEWLLVGLAVLCYPEQATEMSANLGMLLQLTGWICTLWQFSRSWRLSEMSVMARHVREDLRMTVSCIIWNTGWW